MKQTFTPEFLKTLLSGSSPYVKGGYVQFHRFTIENIGLHTRVSFIHKDGTVLAYMEAGKVNFDAGCLLSITIHTGCMKLKVD
jgi:hypothetical protein